MRQHPFFLFGWLIVATVLLSLVGLTAKLLPVSSADAQEIEQAAEEA